VRKKNVGGKGLKKKTKGRDGAPPKMSIGGKVKQEKEKIGRLVFREIGKKLKPRMKIGFLIWQREGCPG